MLVRRLLERFRRSERRVSLPRPSGFPAITLLMTESDGSVFVETGTGRLLHQAEIEDGREPRVGAFTPDARPDWIFLLGLGPARGRIRVASDPLDAEVLSYRRSDATRGGGWFNLRHPVKPRFVCAGPGEGSRPGDLSCNRSAVSTWEEFRTAFVNPIVVPARAGAIAACLDRFAVASADTSAVLLWIDQEDDDLLVACLGAALRLLDLETLRAIGRRALADRSFAGRLSSLCPDDPWLSRNLPGLIEWLDRRPPITGADAGPEFDELGATYADEHGPTEGGSLLVTQMRTMIAPRKRLAVLATGRNEGLYYLEWIAHYRRLGVEHFFIYTNDNSDGSERLLEAIARHGLVTVIANRMAGPTDWQLKVYSHALSWLPQILDYEWTLLIDLDEFVAIRPPRPLDLPSLLAERRLQGATAVSFTWRMFTPGLERRWRPALLADRFRLHELPPNTAVKTAFVTRLHALSHPHDPLVTSGVTPVHQKPSGALHHWEGRPGNPSNGEPEYSVAWINHYYFKSLDEWLAKAMRAPAGMSDGGDAFVMVPRALLDYCRRHGTDGLPLDESLVPAVPEWQAARDALRALDGVGEAEDAVRASFLSRTNAIRQAIRTGIEHDPDLTPEERTLLRTALEEDTAPEDGHAPGKGPVAANAGTTG